MPERIRLSRRMGWRLPEGAVSVARPSRWGNPFLVGGRYDRAQAVDAYREWVEDQLASDDPPDLSVLAGHDLACWCPLDGGPCHADVLLELANR